MEANTSVGDPGHTGVAREQFILEFIAMDKSSSRLCSGVRGWEI
jgi:hypothetical protein